MAIGKPDTFGLIAFLLLLMLLVVFLIDPWMPLIDRMLAKRKTGDEPNSNAIDEEPILTLRIRSWQIRGWMVFGSAMILLLVVSGSLNGLLKYSEQFTCLVVYVILLMTLLLLTLLLYPTIGIYHALKGQENQIKGSLVHSCLVTFQMQGWLFLFGMSFFLGLISVIV